MKLGVIQTAWIKSLREHPERQMINTLGRRNENNYTACCLGELLITSCRIKKEIIPFGDNGMLYDRGMYGRYGNVIVGSLLFSSEKFGLKSQFGNFEKKVVINYKSFNSLAEMNDGGLTWTQIADYVEANPENVFTKSV